jgi:hypothetical protein
LSSALETRDIPNVEILSVGTHDGSGCPTGGCVFTSDDLDELARNFHAAGLDLPLKLGHGSDQRLLQEEGLPAAGWGRNVRRFGDKLIADLIKVPAKVADLIDVGAYRHRSIEMARNVSFGGRKFARLLTGIALLGEELPAVNNLADMTSLYSAFNLDFDEEKQIVLFEALKPDEPRETYVDNAERVLADVRAFTERTEQLVALRAKDGRLLSETHRERIAELRKSVPQLDEMLSRLVTEPEPPAAKQDYGRLIAASLELNRRRLAVLQGA